MKHAGVGDDHAIRPHLADGLDILGQLLDIAVVGEQVERQIGALAVGAGEGHAFQHLLKRQVRPRAQRQVGRAHVNRVRAVEDRDFELFQRAHWHEQLGGVGHEGGPQGRCLRLTLSTGGPVRQCRRNISGGSLPICLAEKERIHSAYRQPGSGGNARYRTS